MILKAERLVCFAENLLARRLSARRFFARRFSARRLFARRVFARRAFARRFSGHRRISWRRISCLSESFRWKLTHSPRRRLPHRVATRKGEKAAGDFERRNSNPIPQEEREDLAPATIRVKVKEFSMKGTDLSQETRSSQIRSHW